MTPDGPVQMSVLGYGMGVTMYASGSRLAFTAERTAQQRSERPALTDAVKQPPIRAIGQ
jgi:hypothetical protein